MTETTSDLDALPQPFGFYRVMTGHDFLHFGYWPEGRSELSLLEAQEAHLQLMLEHLPPAPAKILDVGCGLGVNAGRFHQLGYDVTALAPSAELIAHAIRHYPGPTYLACGFEEDNPELKATAPFDVILLQESLQYFPDLATVFHKSRNLLNDHGKVLICDEVSYDDSTRRQSAVHLACDIRAVIAEQGFVIRHSLDMGRGVTPTAAIAVKLFEDNYQNLLTHFGENSRAEIQHFTDSWRQLVSWYQSGQFGYRFWVLSPAHCRIKPYAHGDENVILPAFSKSFHKERSLAHWQWKFAANPYGTHRISNAWCGTELATHYSGYPVPVCLDEQDDIAQHVGDTFSLPAYRAIGRGRSNLLSRTADHFFARHCEGKIAFCYGFNTDRVQKLGRLFMGYQPVQSVIDWTLDKASLAHYSNTSWRDFSFPRLRVSVSQNVEDWADSLFHQARNQYRWLVRRDRPYLTWRYQHHPDFDYWFFVASTSNRPIGWCVVRRDADTLLLVDALFDGPQPCAFRAILKTMLRWSKEQDHEINAIHGWFSENPDWFTKILPESRFQAVRQHQRLDLCARSFSREISATDIGANFYFTLGDSDLA